MKFILVHCLPLFASAATISKCCGQETDYRPCADNAKCDEDDCKDCLWGPWTEWGACDCDGLQERGRTIESENNDCGAPCEGPRVMTQTCNPDCNKEPANCVFDDWQDWSECDTSCGGGQQFRMRDISIPSDERGTPCTGETKSVQPCNDEPCHEHVNCQVGEWGSWGECSVTCGPGQQERSRTVETPAENGGLPCSAELEESQGCDNEPCEAQIDCVWGNFGDWSACSRSCGGGEKTRGRLIQTAPRNGGKLCEALDMTEVAICSTEPCSETVDCVFGEWTNWDACSCSCNGIRHRVRHIDVFPSKGGVACEGALREVENCNFPCDWGDEGNKEATDCELSEWEEWGACSATCGSSQHVRHRMVKTQPSNGGKPCQGITADVRPCEAVSCNSSTDNNKNKSVSDVDCLWSEWDEWGACSASCDGGQKMRQRQIKIMGSCCGEACEELPSMEVVPCAQEACPCEDCEWGFWSEWGACTCTGLQERHRNMKSHFHLCGKPCEGAKVETQSCQPLCTAAPIHCEFTDWSEWTSCTVTCNGGEIKRSRAIKKNAKHIGGKPCEGFIEEIRPCATESCDDAIDCQLTDWDEWTTCTVSCGGGQQFRDRRVKNEEEKGGKPCKAPLKEVQRCSEQACGSAKDCKWGEWSDWGACSQECGGGSKVRDRQVEQAPRKGGRMCEAKSKSELEACNTHACGEGCRDATWSEWSNFTECSVSCGHGFKRRERNIAITANACGKAVEGLMQEFEDCGDPCGNEEPADCVFSEWTEFGDCSSSCDGVHDRTRRIATFALNGGNNCQGPLKEVGACNVGNCSFKLSIDCVLDEWSPWDTCTAQCGGGMQTRSRKVMTWPTAGGIKCEPTLREIQGCNEFPCARNVDCIWGGWVEWGSCSRECGGGQKIRYRHITTLPKQGGKQCDKGDSVEIAPCNEYQCGAKVYCEFNMWSEWGECSTTCGAGQQIRRRELILNAAKDETVLISGQLNEMITFSFSQLSYGQISSVFIAGMLFSTLSMAIIFRFNRNRQRQDGHEQLLLMDPEGEPDITE